MRAKVIKPFNGRPDNEVQTRRFRPGDVVMGDLAAVAVREGLAEEIADEPPAPAPAKAPRAARRSTKRAKRSAAGE